MSDLDDFAKRLLTETVDQLKGEYAAIPQSVKDVMPAAAALIAKGALEGALEDPEHDDLKHAVAILGNVKVGGQIALNKLMLDTAENILRTGLNFLRGILGL